MAAAGVPTAAWATVADVAAGMRRDRRALPGRAEVRRPGRRQGRGDRRRTRRRRARRSRRSSRSGASATAAVVVEEFLEGEELSLLALCDGERAVPMAPAQDYKRIFDGDEGPNTGGMGSYSPGAGGRRRRGRRAISPARAPADRRLSSPRRGTPFHGVLYAGLMMTADGPEGARVQLPLRRPGDAGGAAAAAQRPGRTAAAAARAGRAGRARARVGPALGGDASCSPRAGYPEALADAAT